MSAIKDVSSNTPVAAVRQEVRRSRARGYSAREPRRIQLPPGVWLGFALLIFWGGLTANPLISVSALCLLPVLAWLLWRRDEPPVLLFACFMQWLQAAVGIFYENSQGRTLDDVAGIAKLSHATWLSLLGVLVLALGMKLALLRLHKGSRSALYDEAAALSAAALFRVFLVVFPVCLVVKGAAFLFGGLAQPLFAAAEIEWVVVVLLVEAVLRQKKNYGLLFTVVAIEFANGLMGFFGGFKEVFFVLGVLLLTSPGRLPTRKWWAIVTILVVVVPTACVWTAIKPEYRTFLSQGESSQAVTVSVGARVSKLIELVSDLNREQFTTGFEESVLRLSYVTFFAHCINNVPDNVPYERGALWLGAIQHSLMPRFLFPGKAVTDDSQRARIYAGVDVAGQEEGASIGIGYMAESYVDFGPYGMFAPIFLLGVFYGLIYRHFVARDRHRVIGMACAVAILVFGAISIETSNLKLLGGNMLSFLVFALFCKFLAPQFQRLINEPPQRRRPRRPMAQAAAP